jgi:hypothetical protein
MAACTSTLRMKSMHVCAIEELKTKVWVLTAVAWTRPGLLEPLITKAYRNGVLYTGLLASTGLGGWAPGREQP